jgi:hypothetical protein
MVATPETAHVLGQPLADVLVYGGLQLDHVHISLPLSGAQSS